MEKKTVFIVAIVLVATAALMTAYRLISPGQMAFDGAQWRGILTDADYNRRYAMVTSVIQLTADGTLNTQDKVLKLLGPGDWESDDRADTWEYRLGAIEGSSDMRLLELTFDANGRLLDRRVKQEVQSRRADVASPK